MHRSAHRRNGLLQGTLSLFRKNGVFSPPKRLVSGFSRRSRRRHMSLETTSAPPYTHLDRSAPVLPLLFSLRFVFDLRPSRWSTALEPWSAGSVTRPVGRRGRSVDAGGRSKRTRPSSDSRCETWWTPRPSETCERPRSISRSEAGEKNGRRGPMFWGGVKEPFYGSEVMSVSGRIHFSWIESPLLQGWADTGSPKTLLCSTEAGLLCVALRP